MFLQQIQSLLPKKLSEGVALNRLVSQHQLSRLRGVLRKLPKVKFFPKFSKIILGASTVLYLSGYQPTLAIPPLKQNKAQAEFSQQQSIETLKLAYPFGLPHPGYISTRFSSWHPGVDIATGLGMPTRPIAPGRVVEVSWGFWGLGHTVIVEHEQNFRSTYGHMGKIFVKKDDIVSASTILGEVGLTGRTTGPHTHLEVTKSGRYIDPQTILPDLPDWPTNAGQAPSGQGDAQPIQPTPTPKRTKATPTLNLLQINYGTNKTEGTKKLPPLLLSASLAP